MAYNLGIDFRSTLLTGRTFKQAIEAAQDSRVQSMWILADAYVFSEDNPDYTDIFEQYFNEAKVSRAGIEKYRSTIRAFPHKRRKWNLSIEMYYTVKALDSEAQQDDLLARVASGDIATRQELRDTVKELKQQPITETTTLDLPIVEIGGRRYVVADDIPADINIVQVKYARRIDTQTEGIAA